MLSKYLPKKLYNAAADEDGEALTAAAGLPDDRLDTIEALLGTKAAQTGSTISEDVDDLVTLVGDYTPEDTDLATDLTAALGDIDDLETYVGDYSSPAGGEGSDIATDLAKVYASVQTATTGLLDRTVDLETAVGTYSGENDIATDLKKVYDDVETAETGLLARAAALEAVAPEYVDTFAAATAAQGTLTLADNVTADDEVKIGSITYKFVAVPAAAYDVAIAGSASGTIDNLIAAITAGVGEGTAYGAGTVAHPDVTAAADQDDKMTVTALVKGAAGNAIGTTDPTDKNDVISFGAAALAGGIDGQVGATGKIIFTDDVVYFCTDGTKCTIADSSGWKSAALS